MRNPYEEATKQKRIAELIKENHILREELKEAKSEAWLQKTTAEILSKAVDIKEQEKQSLQDQLEFEKFKISEALKSLKMISKTI